MVIGNESKYIEGFESFTIDDELMLSNLKQALQYTKDNRSIDDESEDVTEIPPTTRSKITKGNYKNPTTTKSSAMKSSEMNSSEMNSSTIPVQQVQPVPPIPSLKSIFNTGIPGVPTTTFPNSMNINNPRFIANSVNKNPTTTLASSSFKNIKNKFENINQNEKDIEDEIKNDNSKSHVNPYMNESMQDIMDMKKHGENKDNINDETDSEMEDEEDEEDNENYKNYKNNNNKIEGFRSKNNSRNNSIEGFHGSQIVEARYLKHILLALLISFIGYIICMSSIKNYLPINEYAPHLKKFKNLIYVGIFFVITYMCLEIF